jgi:hypothetical protein
MTFSALSSASIRAIALSHNSRADTSPRRTSAAWSCASSRPISHAMAVRGAKGVCPTISCIGCVVRPTLIDDDDLSPFRAFRFSRRGAPVRDFSRRNRDG